MPDIALARVPDRTPIRLILGMSPDLHRRLGAYADHYRLQHGSAIDMADLVPAILQTFLDKDRGFACTERERQSAEKSSPTQPA